MEVIMNRKYHKYMFFICVFLAQLCYFLDIFPKFSENVIQPLFLLGLSTLLIIIQLYRIIMQVLNDSRTDAELASVQKQVELQENQSIILSEHRSETKAIQKNMTERLNMFQSLLDSGDYDRAKACLNVTLSQFQEKRFRPCCQDNLLNAILEGKRKIASRHHIQVEYEILLPEEYGISVTDLSSVIFNLLDNGIEACLNSRCPEPYISLSICKNKEFLTLHMCNTKNPQDVFTWETTKNDPQNHGLGLSIIEEICGQYDGTFQCQDLGDTFDSVALMRC